MQQHFEIAGTGSELPALAVSAAETDQRGGFETGWTEKHTGVMTRYYCRLPETLQSMAVAAVDGAMDAAKVDWKEIDLIIDASTSRYRPIPGNAIHVQSAFGTAASGIPCLDVHSTCLSFILAMNAANAMLAVHDYRHILIVSSEQTSISANWNEPDSAALLGDGAAAVVLRKVAPKDNAGFAHQTFAEHIDQCLIQGGGHLLPADTYTSAGDAAFRFHMDGPAIMRVAATRLPDMFDGLLADNHCEKRSVIVVPHQASPRAMKIMRRLLGLTASQFLTGVESFGNIAAAGIPLMLDRAVREQAIPRGQRVVLLGTSAGYSQAGLLFEYS